MADSDHYEFDEAILVLRARSGDAQAFRQLVESYEQKVLYFILRWVEDVDAAYDILQEVWIAVFRLLPNLTSHKAFRVWLYKIARGKTIDYIRGQSRGRHWVESVSTADVTDEDEQSLAFENAELVHFALDRLVHEHREVLTLYFLEEMRLHEIAEVLECPLGTAKSRMHYAKQAFRSIVREQADD